MTISYEFFQVHVIFHQYLSFFSFPFLFDTKQIYQL